METVRIRVELCSYLRRFVKGYDPEAGLDLVLEGSETISQVMTRLDVPQEAVQLVMVNQKAASPECRLRDGDRIGLFSSFAGG